VDDLLRKPVVALAALVRHGDLSPRELVRASLERIEAVNGRVNAFVDVDAERALADADAVRPGAQPFAGVPIAIKANVPVRDRPLHFGSRFLGDNRARVDAYFVQRLREAGFVLVGLTNLPEFGILPTTEPRRFGATRNPWDLERTPGGSSGGAGAAVAAGMVPVAHGNDGGGSIRIPAACCGLVGLKPSRGRISHGPAQGDSFLATDGVLTHTVADTAALLDVLAGYEVGDATWAPPPAEPWSTSARRAPGKLRIAVSYRNVAEVEPCPDARHGVQAAAALLVSLGHEVVEADPPLAIPDFHERFSRVFGPALCAQIAYGQAMVGHAPQEADIEPLSATIYERARELDATHYLNGITRLQALARSIVAFFAHHDVLLSPALAERPLPIGECTGFGSDPWADFERSLRFTPYTSAFNITGQPAISVPVGFGEDGLPTNVQLAGKPLAEDTLLQLAAQIEAARGPADRLPAL
jgi:amidase